MLDELKDQTAPRASLAGAGDPERDRQREASVLAALRGNLLARSSRHQQGVVYARAMFVEEAGEVAAQLRRSVVAGEVLAELECLGSIVGLNPSVAPRHRSKPLPGRLLRHYAALFQGGAAATPSRIY